MHFLLENFFCPDSASMLEDSDPRPYVKLFVLAHLDMPCKRQGSVFRHQITDIIK